ncbi:MAG: TMEM14 family protein [Parachlamydiales bacterium]|nr:TMEM14 family protein [Parachlamydiales bacterium]
MIKQRHLSIIVIVYGLLLLVGGIMGYAMAKSSLSLACGLIFGTLTVFAGSMISSKPKQAAFASLVLAAFMLIFFIYRFSLTYKMMPAGMMAFVSAVCVILISLFLVQRKSIK